MGREEGEEGEVGRKEGWAGREERRAPARKKPSVPIK